MDELKEINSEVKAVNENSILSRLWRKVITDLKIQNSLVFLINRYLDNGSKQARVTKKKNKSTLVKNITTENMTWKVLMDLIFNLLRIKRFDITITLYHNNGTKSVHTVPVVKDNTEVEQNEESDKKDSNGSKRNKNRS